MTEGDIHRLTIVNRRGLHARAAAKLARLAAGFDAAITVSREGMEAPGTSIMGLMMLGARCGATIDVRAEGAQAAEALAAIRALVADKFDEDKEGEA